MAYTLQACWSEPNTDAEQPPKKRQKDTGGSDMEVDVTNADNMDGIEDTGETSVLRSTTTNKGGLQLWARVAC